MISFPNAKINIGLHVVSKRADNFHNIETVFYPVPLCDILEIVESDKTEFYLSGNDVEGDPRFNLCLKAYNLLKSEFNIPPVDIYLHKVIPTGAGLGGGSSDAAFTLKMLNSIFNLKISVEDLAFFASKLGSDCAFFIKNTPVFASGKGEVFEEISLSLSGKTIVIIKPEVHISTADAYSGLVPKAADFDLRKLSDLNISDWKNDVVNHFQAGATIKHPQIQLLIDTLYKHDAIYAAMSGSGSAVYGIFNHDPSEIVTNNNSFVWKGSLR